MSILTSESHTSSGKLPDEWSHTCSNSQVWAYSSRIFLQWKAFLSLHDLLRSKWTHLVDNFTCCIISEVGEEEERRRRRRRKRVHRGSFQNLKTAYFMSLDIPIFSVFANSVAKIGPKHHPPYKISSLRNFRKTAIFRNFASFSKWHFKIIFWG